MKSFLRTIFLFFVIILQSSFSLKRIDYRDGIRNNVCKELKDDILVYFIFVDTRTTAPWTEFDIRSTLDSMDVAVRWLEKQAKQANINLSIRTDYYIGSEYTTIKKNLSENSVEKTATTPNIKKGLESLNKWSDGIAARVGKDMDITTKDGIPEIKNPRNKERLIAHLRDEYHTESVALLYLVNNYYKSDISLAVNQLNTNDIEFTITSYKYPATIAQSIISLFGGADMYKSIYRRNDKKIRLAQGYFPDDIMQDTFGRNINNLTISSFTKYLIGWSSELEVEYSTLLTDKVANIE